jgi:ABC-type multidrug transport system ATPase subunit
MSQPSGDPGQKTRTHSALQLDEYRDPVGPVRFDLTAAFGTKTEILIGRNPAGDIWLDHPAVSRTHASLRQGPDGSLVVRDLNSTHGITLDGKPVQGEAIWKPGMTLHLGPQALWLVEGKGLTVTNRRGPPNLEARGLTVRVPGREKPILDRVSFSFKPGQFICVLGPSGAGKSTLVQCMQGLLPACGGSLLFGGNPIFSNPAILKGLIGYTPQQMSLHETLTVRQVVQFAAELRLPTDTSAGEIVTHVNGALAAMGVDHLCEQKIASLSGGERKRVELASELVVDPAILLVDEATSSLDPASEARVMEVLARTARQGKLVLCVTHHLDNISKAETLLILGEGKVVYLGPPGGACSHFGVEHLSDAFVRLEDEGADQWRQPEAEPTPLLGASREMIQPNGPGYPRRSILSRMLETARQTGILTRRESASARSDLRYLFIITLMPTLFALIVAAGHWASNFSNTILLTRNLNAEEKSAFASFWPVIHDAAQGKVDPDDTLTLQAQMAYLLENKPAMRKNLASEDLDRIVRGAIEGAETIFPDKFIKNHLTTLKYLSVQMMGLSFMGMLLGLTLMVRDSDIFPRERSVGLSPLAYLLSKVSVLLLATGFQTLVFDGILEVLFQIRQGVNGLEPVPAEYRIGFGPMLLVHWVATLGCACLGVVLGAITRRPDRAIILLGAMMLPQLILGSALGLAAATLPKAVAFVTSPTYWGLRASQITPMEGGKVIIPVQLQVFGDRFIQSVPLALAGMVLQILLYLVLAWWLLRLRPAKAG